MGILERTRQGVGDTLRRRSIHKHRSRIGWQDASRYTHYLKHAQKAYTQSAPKLKPDTGSALDSFRRDGATSFVTSETTALAQDIFERIQTRKTAGEQIWEADNQERGQHNYIGDLWQDFPELEKLFPRRSGCVPAEQLQGAFQNSSRGTLPLHRPRRCPSRFPALA